MFAIPKLPLVNKETVVTEVEKLLTKHRGKIIQQAIFSEDPEKPYGRKVLFQNDQVELLLSGWNPRHFCWPHTHGKLPEGLVFVLSGVGTFKTFPEIGNVSLCHTNVMTERAVVYVPPGEVHSMGNSGNKKLVCLHAYWPPIAEMWIYNPDQTKGWRVSNGGAWQPEQQFTLEERIIQS